MRSRTTIALLTGVLLAAAAVVAVALTRPGCTLDDAPAGVLPVPSGAAPDLAGIGFGAPTYRLGIRAETIFHLLPTPVADVLTTASPEGGALLTAVDPATGATLWSVQVPGGGVDVAVAGDRVVGATRTDRARFFALDLATGTDRVCVELDELPEIPYVAPGDWLPVTADGGVGIVSAPVRDGGARRTGLDATTGRVRWAVDIDPAAPPQGQLVDPATGTAGPYVTPGRIVGLLGAEGYVVADREHVAAVTGDVLAWSAPRTGFDGNRSDEVVATGEVVLVNDYDPAGTRVLDAATGAERWRLTDATLTGLGQRAMLAVGPDVLVVGRRSVLARIDPTTGEVRRADPGRLVTTLAAAPDGRLVVQAGGVLSSHPPAG